MTQPTESAAERADRTIRTSGLHEKALRIAHARGLTGDEATDYAAALVERGRRNLATQFEVAEAEARDEVRTEALALAEAGYSNAQIAAAMRRGIAAGGGELESPDDAARAILDA